jgi:hypothetical protein
VHFGTNYALLILPPSSPDMEVHWQRKAISIVLSMTSSRNVKDVVLFLKKQLQNLKTQEQDLEKVCRVTVASPTANLELS